MEDVRARPTWRKSSYSGGDGSHCVELVDLGEAVSLRDSKDPDGPKLVMDRGEFTTLMAALKR